MDERQTVPVLLAALTEAAKAHGAYEEAELGGAYDENWPDWYAHHMARTLAVRGFEITGGPETPPASR